MQRLAREQAGTPREGQQPLIHAGHEPAAMVKSATAEDIRVILERLAKLEDVVSAKNWPEESSTVHHPTNRAEFTCSQAEQHQPKTQNPDEEFKKLLVDGAVVIARTVRRLQQETTNIFKLERDATITEFKKYRVQMKADMMKVSQAMETSDLIVNQCNKLVLQCLKMVRQFGDNYQRAGETINDAAETAAGRVRAATAASTKAIEEARQKFLASYHSLAWGRRRPALTIAIALLSGILLGIVISQWTSGRFTGRFSSTTHETAGKDG